jgi:hypothetical protein
MSKARNKATYTLAILVTVCLNDLGVTSYRPYFQAKSYPWFSSTRRVATPFSPLVVSTANPFDFSSTAEWDVFYRQQQAEYIPSVEWHEGVPLSDIASVVPPNSTCLMVGCGNSRLPEALLKRPQSTPPKSLIFLDTSQTCLDQLKETYGSVYGSTTMQYVCGDATRLTKYFFDLSCPKQPSLKNLGIATPNLGQGHIDMIIDKGLTDALLCSEGWNGPLERMFHEACRVLTPHVGQYLLISYPLPRTTREFLVDVGRNVGLEWQFDMDLTTLRKKEHGAESKAVSNERRNQGESRVSIALAVKSLVR